MINTRRDTGRQRGAHALVELFAQLSFALGLLLRICKDKTLGVKSSRTTTLKRSSTRQTGRTRENCGQRESLPTAVFSASAAFLPSSLQHMVNDAMNRSNSQKQKQETNTHSTKQQLWIDSNLTFVCDTPQQSAAFSPANSHHEHNAPHKHTTTLTR